MRLISPVVVGALAVAALSGCGITDPTVTKTTTAPGVTKPAAAARPTAAPARPLVVVDRTIRHAPPAALVDDASAFFISYTALVYGKGGHLRAAAPTLARSVVALSELSKLTPTVTRIYVASVGPSSAQVVASVSDGRGGGEPQSIPATFHPAKGRWIAVSVAAGGL